MDVMKFTNPFTTKLVSKFLERTLKKKFDCKDVSVKINSLTITNDETTMMTNLNINGSIKIPDIAFIKILDD